MDSFDTHHPEFYKCPAPDASDEGKRSSGIGELPLNGQDVMERLIRLQTISDRKAADLRYLVNEMTEMKDALKFLAQQVKTLVDALAEDADPDAPLTNYLSGKPI